MGARIAPQVERVSDHLFEIDGLRAIAVLAVVFNHFFEEVLPSGFLGVDVFFVISGYVITRQLSRSASDGWIPYLSSFYARRIKRLLPALLFTVVITTAAFLLLAPKPSQEALKTGYFALFGASNIFLFFSSSNYFSIGAKLNPFTQTWSLGVEEQFYMVFPILMGLAGYGVRGASRISISKTLVVLALASLAAFLYFSMRYSAAAFYLMPMRFWELSVGALTFLLVQSGRRIQLPSTTIPCLVFLLAIFFVPQQWQMYSSIACVAMTSVLLLHAGIGSPVKAILSLRPMVFVGSASYSLYLWHWSVLVLARWTIGDAGESKIVLLLVAGACGVFSYYAIERPLRYSSWFGGRPGTTVFAGVAMAILAVVACWGGSRLYLNNYKALLASAYRIPDVPNWGESLECHGRVQLLQYEYPFDHCLGATRSAEKPQVLYLIGDSHAAQWVFMANKALDKTRYLLRFINTEDAEDFPQAFLSKDRTDTKITAYIEKHARPGDVVMISFHRGHFNSSRDDHLPLDQPVIENERSRHFLSNSTRIFREMQSLGLKVILVRDTPLLSAGAPSSACLFQIRLIGRSICRVQKSQDLHTRKLQDAMYDQLQSRLSNVFIWDPLPFIYDGKDFVDVVDESGEYIMMDSHHITEYESKRLSDNFLSFFNKHVETGVSSAH